MFLSYLVLAIAISLSSIAAWYSIIGLTAIFSAAVMPIIIMGGALEIAKVVITVWLHQYWRLCRRVMKMYLVPAVFFLMLLTSMGIFGFLSKAHLDQAIPTGDVQAKLGLIDEKIKTQRDNIQTARQALRQLDEAVDQTMARSVDEKGADKAAAMRRGQARERATLQSDIAKAQAEIATLNEQRAPIAAEVRKVEAEVGPIKYIAALIYGDNPDQNILERAVRWVIIIIVAVFDPLAIMMVLAATESIEWHRRGLVAKYKNGHRVEDPDPREVAEEERWHERKLFNFTNGLAQNLSGLAGSIKSRFKRQEPVPESLSEIPGSATTEPATNGSVADVRPDDQSVVAEPEPVADTLPSNQQAIANYQVLGDADEEVEEVKSVEVTKELETLPEETVTTEVPEDLDGDYITYNGKLWRREALMAMHPDLWNFKRKATDSEPANVKFGVEWPKFAFKGDQFLRVDYLPTKLFKYNGRQWIEIDKSTTDTYSYDKNYIDYLIEKISLGEYDPELLSDAEKTQLEDILKRDIALKK